MRLSGTRTGELLDAVAARCERLVHGSVREPAERLRQRRFLGGSLVAPVLTAAPAAILFPPLIGIPATLAAVSPERPCAKPLALAMMPATAAPTAKPKRGMVGTAEDAMGR